MSKVDKKKISPAGSLNPPKTSRKSSSTFIKKEQKFKFLNEITEKENIDLTNIQKTIISEINSEKENILNFHKKTTKKLVKNACCEQAEIVKSISNEINEKEQMNTIFDYKNIFQKICDYFLSIYNPDTISFRDKEIEEISSFLNE